MNPLDLTCIAPGDSGGPLLGWPGSEPPFGAADLPPQIDQLRAYADSTSRHVHAMVINIGGNDAEFDDIVIDCLGLLNPADTDCRDNLTLRRVRERISPDAGQPAHPNVEAPLSERYRALNTAIVDSVDGQPDEVYLTALPNPTHDAPPVDNASTNPQDFCDGTQTADDIYRNASRAESTAIEELLSGLNAAMQRAATRHQWIFMPQMFDAWRDHGICAEGASFFRTNAEALRIQGDEGLPLPLTSPGLAHPNEAGYANRARDVADVVEEHVRMFIRPPTLELEGVSANNSFRVGWSDPSPSHVPETRWQIELSSPGSVQTFFSSGAGELDGFSALSATRFEWRVARLGEFQVRVRGCRTTLTGSYCGPYSNAVTVATGVPGSPLDLRRTALLRGDTSVLNPIRLAWTPGPNTPASVRYEVHYGRVGTSCTGTTIQSCTLLGQGGVASTTSTSTRISLPQTGSWRFAVRACSTAGCSPLSGFIVADVGSTLLASPVGTFVVRAPRMVRAGRVARVDIAWRTPGRWTALDRVDVRLRGGRRRIGTVRFTQDDGVLWALRGKRRRFGHPESQGRLAAGPFDVALARSSVVRFGKRSRRVVLRLGLVPRRQLRGRNIRLTISARNDRGRRQRARLAGVMQVR